MGFSKQEYWSELSCPPPGDLPHPGIEPTSPTLQADSFLPEPPGKPFLYIKTSKNVLQKKGEIPTHEVFSTGEHVQKLPSARVNCFPGGTLEKDPPTSAGGARDYGSISGSGRSPGGGKGSPLHYSCSSMDRGAWWATVHRATAAKSWA